MVLGVLLDNAQELLQQPQLTESDLLRRFKVTVRDAHKNGLTSIHDAGLDPMSLAFFNRYVSFTATNFTVWAFSSTRQAQLGTLPVSVSALLSFFIMFSINKIRIYGMSYFDENRPYSGDTMKPVIGAGDGRLNARSIKIFGDGSFWSHLIICHELTIL